MPSEVTRIVDLDEEQVEKRLREVGATKKEDLED